MEKNRNKDRNLILDRIVTRKAREFSLEKRKQDHTGSVIPIFREEWHLYAFLSHPLVPELQLQGSISIMEEFVRTVWFPHPVLITPETRTEFILFANEANIEMHSGGRFWCNEDMDFAYEVVLKDEIIEHAEEEAAVLMFDIPFVQFQDFHAPLMMLGSGTWQSDTAIRYLDELRSEGAVDPSDYGLW